MKSISLKISLIYLFLGTIWILLSDSLLRTFSIPQQNIYMLQLIKGLLFVFVTAGLLYFINQRYLKAIHQSKSSLKENEQRYKSLFEHNNDIVLSLDLQGKILEVNPSVIRLTGYSRKDLVGKHFTRFITEDCKKDVHFHFEEAIQGGSPVIEIGVKHKLGHRIDFNMKSSPIIMDQSITGVYVIGKDITEWKKTEQKMSHMAKHDELTGLPNRIYFNTLLSDTLEHARKKDHRLAVLLINIDRFKNINDSLGYKNGDLLLKAIAKRLLTNKSEAEILSRIGGDEYILLVPYISSLDDVEIRCQKIIEWFVRPFYFEGYEFHITPSIGASTYPHDGKNLEELILHADTAMHRSKKQGKNQYQLYQVLNDLHTSSNLALENDMRKALDRGEFIVYYQPQLDMKTGQIIGVEALLRWEHPQLGMLPPIQFIPIAEETGMIVQIGKWVLETACRQNKKWHEDGFDHLRVSVNLSARQFHQDGFIDTIANVLSETGLDPSFLDLEITESMAMNNVELMFKKMKILTEMGIHFSIDDFGTGYSSLSYLKQFPLKCLKIDKSFVSEITDNSNDSAIVSAIIAMAKKLNLNVIAEGVENQMQLNTLYDLGCNQMQGYLFSRPQPAIELDSILDKDFSDYLRLRA